MNHFVIMDGNIVQVFLASMLLNELGMRMNVIENVRIMYIMVNLFMFFMWIMTDVNDVVGVLLLFSVMIIIASDGFLVEIINEVDLLMLLSCAQLRSYFQGV